MGINCRLTDEELAEYQRATPEEKNRIGERLVNQMLRARRDEEEQVDDE